MDDWPDVNDPESVRAWCERLHADPEYQEAVRLADEERSKPIFTVDLAVYLSHLREKHNVS